MQVVPRTQNLASGYPLYPSDGLGEPLSTFGLNLILYLLKTADPCRSLIRFL